MSTKQRIAKLRAEIVKIQNTCRHTFVLEKQPELKESLARGVFILEPHTDPPMTLICTKCGLTEETSTNKTCPRCFSKMPDYTQTKRGHALEYYFDEETIQNYFYHRDQLVAAISRCPKCSFAHVECKTSYPLK